MAVPEKVVATGVDARKRLLKGALMLSDTVKTTLGPWGSNALIEKGQRVTNDGVTIAREIQLKDEIEHLGARKMQEIASRTNDEVGDGTTTAITIGGALLQSLSGSLTKDETTFTQKQPTSEIVSRIESERKDVTEKLIAMAVPVTTEQQLVDVATVSVEDAELGKLIGEAQFKVGPDGYLLANEVNERECSVEMVKGIRIDNGFGASLFVNDFEKGALIVENARIIMTNHTVKTIKPLQQVCTTLINMGFKDVIIIARGFTNEAIQECSKNIENGFNLYAINAPYTDQAQVMKDMAAVLGGSFINSEERELSSIQISDIGVAARVDARRFYATLTGVDNEGTLERTSVRAAELTKELDGETSDFAKKQLQARIAQLTNGFGIVNVGGVSDTERGYKKDKVDDAVNAVRCAYKEGTVPGSGLALYTVAETLPDTSILKAALRAPYEQIRSTAPSGDYEVPEWVRDPVMVVRVALQKACSVASILATTTIAIATEKPKARYVQEVETNE